MSLISTHVHLWHLLEILVFKCTDMSQNNCSAGTGFKDYQYLPKDQAMQATILLFIYECICEALVQVSVVFPNANTFMRIYHCQALSLFRNSFWHSCSRYPSPSHSQSLCPPQNLKDIKTQVSFSTTIMALTTSMLHLGVNFSVANDLPRKLMRIEVKRDVSRFQGSR